MSLAIANNNIVCQTERVEHTNVPIQEYFFEGAEKLLEIWFTSSIPENSKSLRDIPRVEIDEMLEIAQCRILHSMSNEKMDSYVLSESSLFISDHRIILKTCGSTRLLAALPTITKLAAKFARLDIVLNVYYSRKNFNRPELQPVLHSSFDREIDYLDDHYENGAAYCMGTLKQDRWYLYTMHKPQIPQKHSDHTLEILMTDMPTDVLDVFTQKVCVDGKDCTKKSGIDQIIPTGTQIHEELFEPCGYSMNGLFPDSDQYVTIHVTPEPEFSYASFETNQDRICLYKQTRKVLECFKPRKILMTVFANDVSIRGKGMQQKLWDRELPGYRRSNIQFLRLETGETLVYAHFTLIEPHERNMARDASSDEDDGERSD